MTLLEFIKMMDFDVATKCTFKILGKNTWFFYFVQDDEEGFSWDNVTFEDLNNYYEKGIKWLAEEGPGNYIIEKIEDIDDEECEEGKFSYIQYRFKIRCKL